MSDTTCLNCDGEGYLGASLSAICPECKGTGKIAKVPEKLHAFAELSATGDKIDVWFKYDADLLACIKAVPGSRFHKANDGGPKWTIPLSMDSARRLNEEFGDLVIYGRALKAWGKEAKTREHNLHTLAAADEFPVEKMKLNAKIPELAAWLRPYQRADVMFLAATSALNLNQQRLGKTTEQIGAVFESDLENGAHLVCAPKSSLNTVWRFEIERWTANLEKPHEVLTYSGEMSGSARKDVLDEFWACVEDDWPVWFVCTFDTVRSGKAPAWDLKKYPDGWNTFTIDEYHKSGLPNASGKAGTGSKFADACRATPAKRRYAMSGTPMGGKPIKMWGGLHFLYPKQFTSKWTWAKQWLQMNEGSYGTEVGSILKGREDDFYKSIAPYVVRRLRSEVLPQLPQAQWMDVWCDMTPNQDKQYKQFAAKAEAEIEDKKLNALGILAEYTRLKVFADAYCDKITTKIVRCSNCEGTGQKDYGTCYSCLGSGKREVMHPIPSNDSGKLPILIEKLEEQGIVSSAAKGYEAEGESLAIVASQFKEVADMVHAYLNYKGIQSVKITGDTREEERADYQMMFRMDGKRKPTDPRVIVMTTTAGGVAITLDLVENVHIMDETWVPDDQEQLADRAVNTSRMHQIGVYVYRSKGTIEQHIMDTNIDKREINRQILDLRRNGFRADMQAKQKEAVNV